MSAFGQGETRRQSPMWGEFRTLARRLLPASIQMSAIVFLLISLYVSAALKKQEQQFGYPC